MLDTELHVQQDLLDQARALVQQTYPYAVAFEVKVRPGRGFDLDGVHLPNGHEAPESSTLDDLRDAARTVMAHLHHDGVVEENARGFAIIYMQED